MTPKIHRLAGELFDQLRDLSEQELVPALDEACASDAELRSQVMLLIEGDRVARAKGFLEGRAIESAARLLTSERPELPASGTVIGNYRLGARIGAGGMGVVYDGLDLHLNRRVAVKILPVGLAAEDAERILRFHREARAASSLNHPNIVSIFDAASDQGYHYIAMEFVEGKTLRQLAVERSSRIDSRAILDWIAQTASALGAAHDAGVVHRDIKPENIMIRPDGFVKVLDFGLAKREPSSGATRQSDLLTRPGSIAGTVQYLSPEQVLGEPVGPRSDLFGLGVVAYELATGIRPFDGPTDGAVMNSIVHSHPPPPSRARPDLGTDLDGLIARLLEKDPELRFQTAGDLRSSCRRVSRDYIARTLGMDQLGMDQLGMDHDAQRLPATQDGTRSHTALSPPPVARPYTGRRWVRTTLAALVGIAAIGAVLAWLNRPLLPPRPGDIVQITSDRLKKEYFVNDGTRLFYAAGSPDPDIKMFQIGAKGGEPIAIPALTGMFPLDISPDRSQILLGQYLKGTINGPFPIWVADTLGSAPRRLGGLEAMYARWSPNGEQIAYCNGAELRLARNDGSDLRKLATMAGVVKYPAWSPDGRSIRFTLLAMNSVALWEVASDGTHLHTLFPQWAVPQEQGAWTPDGKFFVFMAHQKGDFRDLWAIGDRGRIWGREHSRPVRLVNGPLVSYHPEIGPAGDRVFFLGNPNRGELVRYNPQSDRQSSQWLPYMGGLPATQLDYSRDGNWVTYASSPEGSVWRSAPDGSRRLQLTAPPLFARNPRWSPDGSQVAFYGAAPGQPDRISLVPASGGAVRQLTGGEAGPSGDEDPSWSPDGASIVFGAQSADQRQQKLPLDIIDLKTRRISTLPGTRGLWSPRWSPDGRYIAALGFPVHSIWLYNVATRSVSELTAIGAGFPQWSGDSRYIYFEDNAGACWYRVRVSDGTLEKLASLEDLKPAATSLGWVGLTPDGSFISTRDAGSTEIYALAWEKP